MVRIKFLTNNWFILIILIAAGGLLAYNIDKPFWGHHDWNGVYWGNVARNYVRYGLSTKLGMVTSVGEVTPKEFGYNFHFSPLYPLTLAVFYKVLGVGEVSARTLAVIFSLGTLGVFYLLVARFFSKSVAISALLFWIVTPMFIYFGKMPVHDVMVLFFAMATVYLFLLNRTKLMFLFLALGLLTGWPAYALVPTLTFFWRSRAVIFLWLVAVMVFASLLIHDYLVTGSFFGGGLAEIFLLRIQPVSLLPYVSLLLRWLMTYYSLLLPLAALGFIVNRSRILLVLLIFASLYPIFFRDSAFRHDYLLIYFLPFLTLASALFLRSIKLTIVIVSLMIVLRISFIFALENSDLYRESVRLGKFINASTDRDDRVLVVIADPNVGFDGWFISYYADRANEVTTDARASDGFNAVITYNAGGQIEVRR